MLGGALKIDPVFETLGYEPVEDHLSKLANRRIHTNATSTIFGQSSPQLETLSQSNYNEACSGSFITKKSSQMFLVRLPGV